MESIHEWFLYNSVKANPDKFQFIVVGNADSHILQINDVTIKSALSVTLLGITGDSKLNFREHIDII